MCGEVSQLIHRLYAVLETAYSLLLLTATAAGTHLAHGEIQIWASTVLIRLQELIDALQATAAAHLHASLAAKTLNPKL